jgi:phenylacetate-CoA ligase
MAEDFPNRPAIVQRQTEQLRALLAAILPANRFYAAKLPGDLRPPSLRLEEFIERVPFTTKQELVADQRAHPPYGTNLTFPPGRYTRCHQTSGTSEVPLRWLDTEESWDWMVANWTQVLRAAGVGPTDRIFFAFSFGPFIGFWLAFEAGVRLGCLCLPGGGLSSVARLRAILEHQATVLCCTPTYALRLAETAAKEEISLHGSRVKAMLLAGEPGGSVPATRARIEALWPGARVWDHHGMTEVGPVTFECPARPGVLHVMENAYIAEVLAPFVAAPAQSGQPGELVLTTLGRTGSPLLRYRTGDLVRPRSHAVCECGRSELALEGGILGRIDDMTVVRGVNVYPSAVEEIIRSCGGVAEFRVRISTVRSLPEIEIQVEPEGACPDTAGLADRLTKAFASALALRVPVVLVPPGTLPRFEMKTKRWLKE